MGHQSMEPYHPDSSKCISHFNDEIHTDTPGRLVLRQYSSDDNGNCQSHYINADSAGRETQPDLVDEVFVFYQCWSSMGYG